MLGSSRECGTHWIYTTYLQLGSYLKQTVPQQSWNGSIRPGKHYQLTRPLVLWWQPRRKQPSPTVSSLTYKLDKPSIYQNLSLIALMCLLCHLESKDLQHFIVHCPAHESTTFRRRTQDISFWFVTCCKVAVESQLIYVLFYLCCRQ